MANSNLTIPLNGSILEEFPLAVLKLDKQFRVIYCNFTTTTIFGKDREEILDKVFFELIPEFNRARIESDYRNISFGQGSLNNSHQAEDGLDRITHKIFPEEEGFTVLMEKEQRQESTHQEILEKEIKELFEGVPWGILLLDSLSGRIVHSNKIIQDWTGYTKHEIENLSLASFYSKEDQDTVSNAFRRLNGPGSEKISGIKLLTKWNDAIPIELLVVSMKWNGRPCIAYYFLDIRTKEEASEREKYREILGNLAIKFIKQSNKTLRKEIEEALEIAGKLSHSDKAFVLKFDKKEGLASTAYEWVDDSVFSFMERMRILPLSLLAPICQKLKSNSVVEYPDIQTLSDNDSVKSILLLLKIKSLILFPIGEGEDILGMVGFGKMNRPASYSSLELFPIQAVSKMISSTLLGQHMEQLLLEREIENEKLFNKSPIGLIYQDNQGNIVQANPASLNLLDISLEEIISWQTVKSEWTAITKKGTQIFSFKEAAKTCIHTSLPLTDQIIRVFRPSKGDTLWLMVNVSPEFIHGGSAVSGIFTTIQDITTGKNQELALTLAETRYRSLIQNLPGPVYLRKADGENTPIDVTDKILELTGYRKEDFISHQVKIENLIHPKDLEKVFSETQKSRVMKSPYQLRYRILAKSGQIKWVEERVDWLSAEENYSYTIGFFRDITQEVENSLALEKNLKLLEALVENSHSSIFVKDLEAKFLMVNRRWEMVTGFSREQVIGKNIEELIDPTLALTYSKEDRKVLLEGKTTFAEEKLEHKEIESGFRGTQYFLSVKFPYRNYRGEIIGMCGISTDITAVKEASMMVEEREANLHSILESVNESILSLDKNLNILFTNQTFFKEFFSAYGVELSKGMNIINVLPDPKERKKWYNRYRTVLDSGETLEFFDRIQTPTKNYHLNVILYPIKINKVVEGVTVFSKDITEKISLEEASKLYLNLFESATNEIYLISSQFLTIKQSNLAAQKNTRYSSEEIQGIPFLKLIPQNEQALFMEKSNAISSKREKASFLEINLLRKDGTQYSCEILLQPFNYEGEEFLSAFVTDITDRKSALNALQESELRFSQIFKENVIPMLLIDPSTGKIEDANYAATDYYGLDIKKLKSLNLLDINQNFAKDPDYMRTVTKEILESGKGKFIFNHKLKSGEIRSVEVFCSKISINSREFVHEIIQDVTDRNNYYNALTKQNEALREIAWIQSHVVRAPLAKIMGLVQHLQDEKEHGNEALFEFIFNAILQAADELDKVILTVSNKSHDAKHLMN